MPSLNSWAILVAAAAIFAAGPALAHEGHDHAPESPPPASEAASSSLRVETSSEAYELLVRGAAPQPGEPVELRLLLADYSTNRPVAGATLGIDASGPADSAVTAVAAGEPGIYTATMTFPQAGSYDLVVSVEAAGEADLLTIPGIVVAARGTGQAPAGRESGNWKRWAAGAGGLALLAIAYLAGRRGRRRRIAVALALALGDLASPTSAFAHAGHDDEAPAAVQALPSGTSFAIAKESQFLLGIRTVMPERRQVSRTVTLLGRLETPPQRQANLHAPVAGQLVAVHGFLGDRVRAGQLLAEVEQVLGASEQLQIASERLKRDTDRADLDSAIGQAEQEVARARADQGRMARLRDLYSARALQDAQTTLRKAEQALAGLEEKRRLYRTQTPPSLERARRFPIRAPFGGVIVASHATLGEQVEPTKPLLRVADPRTLWVEADVYERDLATVTHASSASLTVAALPARLFRADLATLGGAVDPQTRTLKARFSVDNRDGALKPGMSASLAVSVGGAEKVLTVPEAAVADLGGRAVVFVHEAAERFGVREIRTGAAAAGWVAIVEGVRPEDRVVSEGVYQVKLAADKGVRR